MNTENFDPGSYPITFLDNTQGAIEALCVLGTATHVAIDTETVIERDEDGNIIPRNLDVDGPGPWRVMSIAARWADGTKRAFVLDMGYVDAPGIAGSFAGIRPFGWNANFDRGVCVRAGIALRDWWDGMLADAVLRCGAGGADGRKYTNLARAAKVHLGYEVGGKKSTRMHYQTVEAEPTLSEDQILYAALDAIVTLEVSMRLGALLRAAGLVPTFVRECNGQRFIQDMVSSGIPINVESYSEVIAEAAAKSATAAERVAVATTGRELLSTLVAWHTHTTGTQAPAEETENVEHGLALLHDVDVFAAFIADLTDRANLKREKVGELLGTAKANDLFTEAEDATFVPLPFDPTVDTEVRAWLSKQAPHFTAAYVLASRGEGNFADLIASPYESVKEAAGRRGKFTKDHDADEVINAFASSTGYADVTETLAALATELLAMRKFLRIVNTYAPLMGTGEVVRLVPSWNVGSDVQVKEMLNTHFLDLVHAYTGQQGNPRPLEKSDSVDADTLKLIGGELCNALLAFRAADKIVTTYGDALLSLVHPVTGRIHARYNQALTGTGRLSSYKPNAQNLSPLAKPHMRPARVDGKVTRVLVCADLSQAEKRFVAHMSGDENMLNAFRLGEDLHERTAGLMNSVDMKALKASGDKQLVDLAGEIEGLARFVTGPDGTPEMKAAALYKLLRGKAKAVGFGYDYGLKGGSLANQLTVSGVPTTKEEADELLAKFDVAFPQVAAWMKVRTDFIDALSKAMRDSKSPSGVDFASTWKLHLTHSKAHSAYNAIIRATGETPTGRELAEKLKPNAAQDLAATLGREATTEEVDAKLLDVEKLADWALTHDHPVVLADAETPWSFESRTTGGRRRLFQVRTDHLMMAVVTSAVRSRDNDFQSVAESWLESWNARAAAAHAVKVEAKKARGAAPVLSLTKPTGKGSERRAMDSRELEKVFEDREMRTDFVGFALQSLPAARMEKLWRTAMADRIRAMSNQYRNHPIQGGVADAMLEAFARITADLDKFQNAVPIQSVHDSVVVECDVADAAAVRDMVVGHMQDALAGFCPSVPVVADGDIQLSLDDKTVVDDEQLAALIADLVLAA